MICRHPGGPIFASGITSAAANKDQINIRRDCPVLHEVVVDTSHTLQPGRRIAANLAFGELLILVIRGWLALDLQRHLRPVETVEGLDVDADETQFLAAKLRI